LTCGVRGAAFIDSSTLDLVGSGFPEYLGSTKSSIDKEKRCMCRSFRLVCENISIRNLGSHKHSSWASWRWRFRRAVGNPRRNVAQDLMPNLPSIRKRGQRLLNTGYCYIRILSVETLPTLRRCETSLFVKVGKDVHSHSRRPKLRSFRFTLVT
jgi:hypothetical protein